VCVALAVLFHITFPIARVMFCHATDRPGAAYSVPLLSSKIIEEAGAVYTLAAIVFEDAMSKAVLEVLF
jgi:hypothetical protein